MEPNYWQHRSVLFSVHALYSVNGQSIVPKVTYKLAAAVGYYVLSGKEITFNMIADQPAVCSISGQDISFTRALNVKSDCGYFTITGKQAYTSGLSLLNSRLGLGLGLGL